MPPRLRNPRFRLSSQKLQNPSSHCQCLNRSTSRLFSSTPYHGTRARNSMFQWLNGPGSIFKDPPPGSTCYLGAYDKEGQLRSALKDQKETGGNVERNRDDLETEEDEDDTKGENHGRAIVRQSDRRPFPLNQYFKSQSVLSEELKDEIWRRVMEMGQSVKVVSTGLNVEMRRVGAVVRLKSVEKQWVEQGKRLATPYAKTILSLLPQTPFFKGIPPTPHESINDLPVHNATQPQIFHPVAESRHFTRADAGKVFARDLLPAEARIPHPELVQIEKLRLAGVDTKPRIEIVRRKMLADDTAAEERRRARLVRDAKALTRVVPLEGKGRAEFRFRDVSVESVGKDGRSRYGVGARYGVPHQDRKRGQIKIPRRVDA